VENEHNTILDQRGKSAPELVVDDHFTEVSSILNLLLIDGTNDEVEDETNDQDEKDDKSSSITATARDRLTTTVLAGDVNRVRAVSNLLDHIDERIIAIGIASDGDGGGTWITIAALITVAVLHHDALARLSIVASKEGLRLERTGIVVIVSEGLLAHRSTLAFLSVSSSNFTTNVDEVFVKIFIVGRNLIRLASIMPQAS